VKLFIETPLATGGCGRSGSQVAIETRMSGSRARRTHLQY